MQDGVIVPAPQQVVPVGQLTPAVFAAPGQLFAGAAVVGAEVVGAEVGAEVVGFTGQPFGVGVGVGVEPLHV